MISTASVSFTLHTFLVGFQREQNLHVEVGHSRVLVFPRNVVVWKDSTFLVGFLREQKIFILNRQDFKL